MHDNKEGYSYPIIDNNKCINCARCVRMCPSNNKFTKHPASFYMGWHKDDNVLLKSSSGGAITALAQITFARGGVVFGAYMDQKTHDITQVEIHNEEELDKIRLSKYYQGFSNHTYARVKELIKQSTYVMFTGVACQIAGLLSYLEKLKDSPYLLTVDVLCHGVANKDIVNAYLADKEKQMGMPIDEYRFRVKPDDSDWYLGGGTRFRLHNNNNVTVVDDKELSTFFVGFNSYLFLRKSCYECRYTGTDRISDITLADFWGIEPSKVTDHELKMGVSAITLNTDKARDLLDQLKEKMVVAPVDAQEVVPYNQAFDRPATPNENRDKFFENYKTKGFDKTVHRCQCKYYTKKKIKRALTAVIGENGYEKLHEKLIGRK